MAWLCISVRFIQPYPLFHGRRDADESEWPPSPLRLFQAMLNAACLQAAGGSLPADVRSVFKALEPLRPTVIAPPAKVADGYRAYVPHNQADVVAAAWTRGQIENDIAAHRIEKDYRPHRIGTSAEALPAIHYVYRLDTSPTETLRMLEDIRSTVRSVHRLGWGIDQVCADVTLVDTMPSDSASDVWIPASHRGTLLRVPRVGSLEALMARHEEFLTRLVDNEWTPVPPLRAMDQIHYRRVSDPVGRPFAVFKLVDADGDTVTYPQSKLVHVAGMVRHLAIEAMQQNPPRDLRGRTSEEWLDSYVGGHQFDKSKLHSAAHTQLSYIPLQSIGHPHADPGVRRVMIVAPVGDEQWLEHLARHLDGVRLQPLPGTKLPPDTRLERIAGDRKDGVSDCYLRPSTTWASTTPVILPGHDDRKPEKIRSLIVKALQQSGVEQRCTFDWSAFSRFPTMLSAHKYRRDPGAPTKKVDIGYIRPSHLLEQTAVHLTLMFENDVQVPGPITLGAGRHCGFGVMASV